MFKYKCFKHLREDKKMLSLHLVSLSHITLNLNVFCLLLTFSLRDCSPGYQVFIQVNKALLQSGFVASPLSCVIKLPSLLSLFQGMNKRPLHAEECRNEKAITEISSNCYRGTVLHRSVTGPLQ